MILNNEFIHKWLQIQYPNILVYGDKYTLLNYLNIQNFNQVGQYKRFESTYLFNIPDYKKKKLIIDDIKQIICSKDYFGVNKKKNIIITDIQLLNKLYHQSIKTFINQSYETAIFMIHSDKLYSIEKHLRNILLSFMIPVKQTQDETMVITYKRVIKLLKKPLTKSTLLKIKEIVYYYYMNHKNSVDFQLYLIEKIGSNLYLPNYIKFTIVSELAELNKLYQYSYRKPIFLEGMILCLFKHLENYSYNL
jgi:hypothetical protein